MGSCYSHCMRTIERDIVGGFLFSGDDKILLAKNRKGGVFDDAWVVPGGGVDEGETKEQGAIREVLEEVGVDVSAQKITPLGRTSRRSAEKTLRENGERVIVDMTFYDFRFDFDVPADQIPVQALDDLRQVQWFNLSQLPILKIAPPTRNTLQVLGYL